MSWGFPFGACVFFDVLIVSGLPDEVGDRNRRAIVHFSTISQFVGHHLRVMAVT